MMSSSSHGCQTWRLRWSMAARVATARREKAATTLSGMGTPASASGEICHLAMILS